MPINVSVYMYCALYTKHLIVVVTHLMNGQMLIITQHQLRILFVDKAW